MTSGPATSYTRAIVATGRTPTAAVWVRATGRGRVHFVHDAEHVSGPALPIGTDVDLTDLRKVQTFAAPEVTVVELPGASVWSSDGVVVTQDGCVLEDLIRRWGSSPEQHPIWQQAPTEPRHIAGTVAVVAARGAAANFSHFLADTLPRIGLVRATGISVDTWLMSSTRHAWQRDALQLGRIPAATVIGLDDHPIVQADSLIVPSPTGFAPTTAPWARHQLRRILNLDTTTLGQRRIIISRQSATRRRLRNEDALVKALTASGFETVDFATLPLREQIIIVSEASIIVGIHGAGLSHLLHAPAGGHLIEITQPHLAHPEYWRLAALSGWLHTFTAARSTDNRSETLNDDLEVDVAEVIARC